MTDHTTPGSSAAKNEATEDIDALIRQAELRVVEADRSWQRHGDQLSVSLRSQAATAGKVGIWGGVGLAVAAVGTGLIRWRAKARARAEARTVVGRAKGVVQGLAKGVADKWAGLTKPQTQPPAPVPAQGRPTSRVWELVVTTIGLLLGAAARTGPKTSSSRRGIAPLVFSFGLPMLRRWLGSRSSSRKGPTRR